MKIASKFQQFFKNAKRNILPVLLCSVFLVTAATAKTPVQGTQINEDSQVTNNNFAPYATFQNLWIDYNVTQDGQKGMLIHTAFKTFNMKGIPGYLALYFQYRNGTAMKDRNGKFNSADDTVAVYREINPGYQVADFEDEALFMPYDELDLDSGKYELRIDASIIYKQGGLITRLKYYDFDYNNSSNSTTNNKKPSATFETMWVDYDVRQGGKLGMVAHIKANVFDMKGKTGHIAFYFQKKDNSKLFTSNQTYRSNDPDREGQVVAYYAISPGFDNALYEDASVFMPYSEFNVPSGRHELVMDVDLIDKNGGILQHIHLYPFWYKK